MALSSLSKTFSDGLTISNYWFAPEELIREKCGEEYEKNPTLSRVKWIIIKAPLAIVKTLAFGLVALAGTVTFLAIAVIQFARGKESAKWLAAWVFSILAVGTVCAFMSISAFYLPASAAGLIFMSAIALCITIHVYIACKAPPLLPKKLPSHITSLKV